MFARSPAPDQRRIDVEVGALVIECKRDLRTAKVLEKAEIQLAGYLTRPSRRESWFLRRRSYRRHYLALLPNN